MKAEIAIGAPAIEPVHSDNHSAVPLTTNAADSIRAAWRLKSASRAVSHSSLIHGLTSAALPRRRTRRVSDDLGNAAP